MGVIYRNRKGRTYCLCYREDDSGKRQYFFTRNPSRKGYGTAEAVPPEYSVQESDDGQVMLVKGEAGSKAASIARSPAVGASGVRENRSVWKSIFARAKPRKQPGACNGSNLQKCRRSRLNAAGATSQSIVSGRRTVITAIMKLKP